ncbi:VanW family protein [Clostridium botulinum]|nr:VanW family protein [Clostridium botulinum]
MPGESFSFNNTVGPRTEKRGYQGAPVIIGNKIESGLGEVSVKYLVHYIMLC